ncbi:MAG: permease [Rhodospirillales bacterium]|nr:permease [Rhodospirillales bacterium]
MLTFFTKLADLVTYQLFRLSPETPEAEVLHFFIEDTAKIFFLLVTLVFIVGFFRSWLAPDKVRQWLEKCPRLVAYGLAVILGALTPFCSCSSIPVFIAFLSARIPLGITMAFLIASPMINEVAALMFGEIIGWHFTLAYIATGMITGIIGGLLIDSLKLEKWVEPLGATNPLPGKKDGETGLSLRERLQYAKKETADIVGRVWHYIIIGVGVGAIIHGYVPQNWFIEHAGTDNFWAVPLAVVMAIPLYASVTGTVPIAEALIDKGLPVGTTLAFIMSTVAISLPELMILRRVLKPQMLAFFVVYLVIAFILTGYGFNFMFRTAP